MYRPMWILFYKVNNTRGSMLPRVSLLMRIFQFMFQLLA